jgi:hypothetical protein
MALSSSPGAREVFIAEHHSVSFYLYQENVGKVEVLLPMSLPLAHAEK